MRMRDWGFIGIIVLAFCTYSPLVWADEQPGDDAKTANMPKREQDLIAILMDARKQYLTGHSASPAQEARMAMQIQVMAFVGKGPAFQDWLGTVKSHGTTPDGDAWLSIEIADGITISTWQKKIDDANASSLMKPHTPIFALAQAAKIGRPIVFSGVLLNSMLTKDEEMVSRPEFIAKFTDLKVSK